jgi:ABC-type Zn uptake system ZnuABC Zn-binding protein ZnuA
VPFPSEGRGGSSVRRGLRPLVLLAVGALLAGCGTAVGEEAEEAATTDMASEPEPEAQEPAESEPAAPEPAEEPEPEPVEPELRVVATVAPVADLVGWVGGDRVEVAALIPAGADSHTYEPRPGDVVGLAEADAYLGIGLDLNGGALRLAEENLPDGAPLVLLGEALPDDALVMDHTHSHDDGHSHSHTHSHDDDGHSHSHGDDGHTRSHDAGPNPHVWTSVRNASLLVGAIAEVLSDLDPAGAERYAVNATAAQDELAALDVLIRDATVTIPTPNRTLVTYHDAWTYFARDYDLEFATAVQPADYSDPSAAEVRAVIDLVRDLEVPAVFGSELFPTPVLEAISEETGASYVADLNDDVLPGQPGDPEHSYLELMRRNAAAIVAGLGGDASGLG